MFFYPFPTFSYPKYSLFSLIPFLLLFTFKLAALPNIFCSFNLEKYTFLDMIPGQNFSVQVVYREDYFTKINGVSPDLAVELGRVNLAK